MQELLSHYISTKGGLLLTTSLLPTIVYLCTNKFLEAFISSFTVIEHLFNLTWTKKYRLQYVMMNYNAFYFEVFLFQARDSHI